MKHLFFVLESLLSFFFLKVQSRFSVAIVEYFAYLGKTNSFPITRGSIELSEAESRELRKLLDDGEKWGSITVDFSLISDLSSQHPISQRLREATRGYVHERLGDAYRVHYKLVRNLTFDKRFENAEVYSNRWHQDSDLGTRQIKAFLALHPVEAADGPLTFLSRQATKRHWSTLGNRFGDANTFGPIIRLEEEETFEAARGDFVIVNTARHLHRATIPTTSRDLLIVTFVPTRLPLSSNKKAA